jgi:hypothetical protein
MTALIAPEIDEKKPFCLDVAAQDTDSPWNTKLITANSFEEMVQEGSSEDDCEGDANKNVYIAVVHKEDNFRLDKKEDTEPTDLVKMRMVNSFEQMDCDDGDGDGDADGDQDTCVIMISFNSANASPMQGHVNVIVQ